MKISFKVTVETEKAGGGKFASKEAVVEAVQEALEQADPSEVQVEDATYEIQDWTVEHLI